ncbi:MAG: TetR/AcrR family transcriptional regulator [Lachnospiraceae bacterium]
MDQKGTKQIILDEALSLFAISGYEGVTVADIAKAVGIKAPSLYKHYQSKQDIFNAILTEMEERYKKRVTAMQMNGMDANEDAELFTKISEEQLIEMGKELFLYFLHDDYALKFRRMLTIEQYRDQKLSELLVKQYVDDPLAYQGMLFQFLIGIGGMKQENPQIMALHFYAPMYLMLTLCDSHPEREKEVLTILEQHIRQFNRLYQSKES